MFSLLLLHLCSPRRRVRRKRKRKLKRKRKRATEFLKLERRKTLIFFLLFTVQISSNGRSRLVCGPIDLKFEGEIFNSLISNLNGGDRIWSSGRLLFQSVNSASLLLNFFSPGQFWSSALIEINPWTDRDDFWLARS